MGKVSLKNIFLRSLLIQGSWNFWRMQNLGVAFSMLPVAREAERKGGEGKLLLLRHLQRFSTHPCFTAPILGAVVRMEEEGRPQEAVRLKETLMAPYAALGDSLFGSSLAPLASAGSLFLALAGCAAAPLFYLLVYHPLHVRIRAGGWQAGYRKGRDGVDFIRAMDIPRLGAGIRWLTAVCLGCLALWIVPGPESLRPIPWVSSIPLLAKAGVAAVILGCFFAVKKGVPAPAILYGVSAALVMMLL